MYLLYSAALALGLALTAPWWLLNLLRHGKYRAGLSERLGRVPARVQAPDNAKSIWVHAVSVGEVLAASGLVAELRARFPGVRVVISTTTATGQSLARQRFGEEDVFYFPLDFAFAVRRWLRALRPELVVLTETEFWPNFLRLAKQSGARVAVVNARISDRSFPRYRRFAWLMRRILGSIDVYLAQGDEDRRRLIAIGANPERVHVGGNLKFDVKAPAGSVLVAQMRTRMEETGGGPVLVCGSTVEGEEELLLPAIRAALEHVPGALVVLAPRHPERFAVVAELLRSSGLRWWRRSQWNGAEAPVGGVFLLDTIGELAPMYALADVAFVGGSLVPRGGHNILEPAQQGAAVLVGPHTENFRDIIASFQQAQAVRAVEAGEITRVLLELLRNERARKQLASRGMEVVRAHSGATARTIAVLEKLLAKRDLEVCPKAVPSEAGR